MMDSDFSSSPNHSTNITHKRPLPDHLSPNKKLRTTAASIDLKHFDLPLFQVNADGVVSTCDSMRLHADQPYTIGRRPRNCEFVFRDRRVSKKHCQILLDGSLRKLYILNGILLPNDFTKCVVHEFRKRVMMAFLRGSDGEGVAFREASNGVFVNGVEIRKGIAAELSAGDKVSLVCGNQDGSCGSRNRIGFVVQRIDFDDDDDVEIDGLTFSGHSHGKLNKRVFAVSRYERVVGRANFILDKCRDILLSDDPLSCVMHAVSDIQSGRLLVDSEVQSKLPPRVNSLMEDISTGVMQSSSALLCESKVMALDAKCNLHHHFCRNGNVGVACVNAVADKNPDVVLLNSIGKENLPFDGNEKEKHGDIFYASPGKNFYLNRLEFMDHGSSGLHHSISLPELLYPVESISRMFIATFTSDIKWCDYLNLSNVLISFRNILFSNHFVS